LSFQPYQFEPPYVGKTPRGGDAAALSEAGTLELGAAKPAQVLLFDLN